MQSESNKSEWQNTSIKELFNANAHLGCAKNKRHPLFEPYIFQHQNNNLKEDIINPEITFFAIKEACKVLYSIAKHKSNILFLCSSNQAKSLVEKYAKLCMQNYMLTWPGGFITNFDSILKSKNMAFNDSQINNLQTKQAILSREKKNKKLQKKYIGIKDMKRLPSALIVVNSKNHKSAISEAMSKNIPVITISDSDTKPYANNYNHGYTIPLNINSHNAVEVILNCFSKSILLGLQASLKINKKPSTSYNKKHSNYNTTKNNNTPFSTAKK